MYPTRDKSRSQFRQPKSPHAALAVAERVGRQEPASGKLQDAPRAKSKKPCSFNGIDERFELGTRAARHSEMLIAIHHSLARLCGNVLSAGAFAGFAVAPTPALEA